MKTTVAGKTERQITAPGDAMSEIKSLLDLSCLNNHVVNIDDESGEVIIEVAFHPAKKWDRLYIKLIDLLIKEYYIQQYKKVKEMQLSDFTEG